MECKLIDMGETTNLTAIKIYPEWNVNGMGAKTEAGRSN